MSEETTSTQTTVKDNNDPNAADRSRMTSIFIGILLVLAAFLAYNFFQSEPKNNNQTNRPTEQANALTPTTSATPTGTSTETPGVSPAAAANEYVVEQGDTLWSIAEKKLNDGFLWKEIAKANNISDSSQLKVGSKLAIPTTTAPSEVAANTQPTVEPTKAPTDGQVAGERDEQVQPTNSQGTPTLGTNNSGQKTYTVQKGDTLWSIAERVYGDGAMWHKVFDLSDNHLSMHAASNGKQYPIIHSGNVLILPDAPTT